MVFCEKQNIYHNRPHYMLQYLLVILTRAQRIFLYLDIFCHFSVLRINFVFKVYAPNLVLGELQS